MYIYLTGNEIFDQITYHLYSLQNQYIVTGGGGGGGGVRGEGLQSNRVLDIQGQFIKSTIND